MLLIVADNVWTHDLRVEIGVLVCLQGQLAVVLRSPTAIIPRQLITAEDKVQPLVVEDYCRLDKMSWFDPGINPATHIGWRLRCKENYRTNIEGGLAVQRRVASHIRCDWKFRSLNMFRCM